MNGRAIVDGTIQHVIFQNEDNGYTVLRLVTDDGEAVTVVGTIPCAAPGENLIITGQWVTHPVHGEQFQAGQVERHLPTSVNEILNYLSSGIMKGVGPATAERLVAYFGDRTLQVLEDDPEQLSQVKGITPRRAKEIVESFRYQTGMRRLLEFLTLNDLPLSLALQLYRRYGASALEHVKNNPYILVDDMYGIDFSVMDGIALSMGMSGDNSRRVEAAVVFELSYNLNNGHVFLPREKLTAAAAQLIGCPADRIETALDNLIQRGSIRCGRVARLDACYLRRLYEAETYVTQKLGQMLRCQADRSDYIASRVDQILEQIEEEQGISYAPAQRRAVELAAKEGLILLTGGPGTGKTTSVRGILALLDRMGCTTLLMAPTGRAAQRLGEMCGREAQTIHRALGMSRKEETGEVTFQKNEREPLQAEAVIVDEMSMVDLPLMSALLCALKPDCRLVMVGDPDQLPSVGPGNVFGDLIRSGQVEMVSLTEIFRQAQASAIVRAAHTINQGQVPDLRNHPDSDFFFMRRRDPAAVVDLVVELCRKRLPDNMGIPASQIQVLCPTRKGRWGTAVLNQALQAALNPPSEEKRQVVWGGQVFRTGDRVMQIRNNYDVLWVREDGVTGSGIFNGDVGIVEEIDPAGELLTLCFDGRTATYTVEMLVEVELAYAVTVHKSQGSEYQAVVLAAMQAAPALMVRGVLYTGVTRARELLVVVGDDAALSKMAANDRQQRRYSGLCWRLRRMDMEEESS